MSTKNLEELYTTDDLSVLKKAIAKLTSKKDYKTLNTLFRRNSNASKFDTRSLNEDIPQKSKRLTKRNGKLCKRKRHKIHHLDYIDELHMYHSVVFLV